MAFETILNDELIEKYTRAGYWVDRTITDYLDVKRGQFLLTANPDGTTTLRGTTWYDILVEPVGYGRWWSQHLLHAIHMRVLEHIRHVSEHPATKPTVAAEQPPWMATANATCRCTRHRPPSAP